MNPESDYRDDYPTCQSTYASLLAYHEESPHSDVSATLAVEPTMYVVRGEGRWTQELGWRDTHLLRHKWNIWGLGSESDVTSRDALRHVDWLLFRLAGKSAELEALKVLGWTFKVSVFWASAWGHGGPRLTPRTMASLAQLGLPIEFDVYDSDSEEEPVPDDA